MTVDVRFFAFKNFVITYDRNEDKNRDAHGRLVFPRRLYVLAYDNEMDVVRLEPLSWNAAGAVCKPELSELRKQFCEHRDRERDSEKEKEAA